MTRSKRAHRFRFAASIVVGWGWALASATGPLAAQDTAVEPADSSLAEPVAEAPGLPVFFTLGFAYGERADDCTLCESPLDVKSFSAHVSVGKYLTKGLGVGIDGSIWKRGRPGTPGPADSTGAVTATSLSNQLGNVSVSLSWETWHLWLRTGVGLAFGSQDQEEAQDDATPVIVTASGRGIGYSFGGGLTLPLHPMISLAAYGNYNVGNYDLTSVNGVLERGTQHRFWEVGIGVSLR